MVRNSQKRAYVIYERSLISGVFSTGATGAIAPVILRKRPIAPVILQLNHLIVWTLIHIRYLSCNLLDTDDFFEIALKFLLRFARTYLHFIINVKRVLMYFTQKKGSSKYLLTHTSNESFFDRSRIFWGALCVEMGFTWTFPRNQDAPAK